MTPIVSVVGKSNAGKTTLLEKLIPELKHRGYRVAVIKHHAHGEFEVDQPGKDSWRHAQAGADVVVIASPVKVAQVQRATREPSLREIAARLTGVDLILTEGYKRADTPKIEVSRQARSTELICDPAELIAVAADYPVELDVPAFELEDTAGLADLIEMEVLQPQETDAPRVSILVDGEPVALWKPFTVQVISGTIRGLLSALQGVGNWRRVVLTVERHAANSEKSAKPLDNSRVM